MRKVYMSFLGTTDYFPCNYTQDGFQKVENVRFVQEATIAWHCMGWNETDEILIFTTDESHAKNWLDKGHGSATREGLQNRLKQLNLQADINETRIPVGKDEQEIWTIFATVFEQLKQEDLLYLDITHAFRSLPLLAIIITNYAKAVKNVQVQSISYGAMEAIGMAHEVKKMDITKRNVPVFDLLAFDRLLDWSGAIDRFIGTGDASALSKLTTKDIKPVLKATKGQDPDADGLRRLACHLETFSETMSTCRGKRIVQDAKSLKEAIRTIPDQSLIPPLSPLFERLEDALSGFQGHEIGDGIAATRWCLEHNLIQQGFTILQETICSYVLNQTLPDRDTADKDLRSLVNKAVKFISNNTADDQWDETAQEKREDITKISKWMKKHDALRKCIYNLAANRNDLNHAGINENPMTAGKFTKKLAQYLEEFENYVSADSIDRIKQKCL